MTPTKNNINDVKARLQALGFGSARKVGLNILEQETGETLILKIESDFTDFVKKDGKTMKYLSATNLETGEEGCIWAGGQLQYQLKQMKDGFIGGVFAITYKGLIDVEGEEMHQYDVLAVN